jgi:DNA-directed RNA polymerase specialized sigma24 family protein
VRREEELTTLIAEQKADSVRKQRPERYGLREANGGTNVTPLARNPFGEARPLWGKRGLEPNEVKVVRGAIESATPAQQEAFRMIFVERLTWRAAAEQLGISDVAVKKRLDGLKKHVAREMLRVADPETVADLSESEEES